MVKATTISDVHAELERLPEHLVGEILQGELLVSPRPANRHSVASSSIHGELFRTFGRGGRRLWWILVEPELHLSDDVLVPDIAGWRRERLPSMPDLAYVPCPPDWVCEILSPRTAALDRARKLPVYAREGVPFLWLVDPVLKTLEVYLLREENWLLHAVHQGDETVNAPPFEEIDLGLAVWWLPNDAPPPEADPDPQAAR